MGKAGSLLKEKWIIIPNLLLIALWLYLLRYADSYFIPYLVPAVLSICFPLEKTGLASLEHSPFGLTFLLCRWEHML